MTASQKLPRVPPGQTLLFDADDTLWENNIYFERAIAAFISFLNHAHFDRRQVREVLNQIEHQNTRTHGYGLHSFQRSLVNCFEHLSTEPVDEEKHLRISEFVAAIADHQIELLPGVAEALPQLAQRHQLVLMTKGREEEQVGKLERSGLASHFSAVEIVPEKNAPAYAAVLQRHHLTPASTWMIGNSPRSDINPALSAGMHAVFIPHVHTWVLEHDQIAAAPPSQHLLQLERFELLAAVF